MSIRTRFAPSPTGYLHIGGVRTALFNWLLAKQSGGQFILRIDDTDQQRNVEAALHPILEGFRWLGLTWDEGPDVGGPHAPYFQSQRSDRYQAAVEKLLASGAAYRDYARTEELQEQRTAAEKSGATYIYDRRWMAESDDAAAAFEAEGRVGVVRLKIPREGKCQFNDIIRGPVEFDWAAEQDHVIQRTDGTCLYHLASVVDDYDYQITHVVRAVEHLPNTPRQIFIAQSLGYPLPIYAHLPYVAEPNGTAKLSKRKLDKYLKQKDFAELFNVGQKIAGRLNRETTPETFNPVVVDFYREIGFLPDAILNYLILLGWSLDDKTEHFTKEDMIQHFSLERVNKAPASFDPQKLIAFQTRWMNNLSVDEKVEMVLPYLKSAKLIAESPSAESLDRVQQVVLAASDRIKMAGDILQFDDFFVADTDLIYDTELCSKRITNDAAAVELLKAFRELLDRTSSFDAASTEQLCKSMLEERGAKIGQIIHALRASVTGKASGFAMFDTLAILGKTQCLSRIDQALARFAS